jgi:hypothetical protein
MSKVIIDDALKAKLNGLARGTEFLAPDGRSLGFFVTSEEYLDLVHAQAQVRFTPDEIERLRRQSGGRPLPDILTELEKK